MKEYLQMLIWMMLFVIVIEMVFPDSSYRKYIKLILGCILVYTLLQPLVGMVQGEKRYDDYVKYYQERLGGSEAVVSTYNEQLEEQQETLKRYYEEGIKNIVESEFEVSVISSFLNWEDNQLSQIHLVIGQKTSGNVEIGKIQIGDKSDSLDGAEENLKNKIKTCLSDFYNVQVCNIHITVQKN